MTVSDLEKILWDTLDINDGVDFDLEALTFKPAEKRPEWADNPDADGAVLVQEAHYTNAYFEGQIRVVRAEDTDAALDALGQLMDALQVMERTEGGLPIPWTPNGSTRTLTWYALLGELSELPTVIDGELAGWFLDSPVMKFKLTCRPFGYREERVVLEATSSTAPLQVVYIDGIEGDVPAEGTLRVTDKATQDRRYMEWGQDVVESAEGNPGLELEADKDLVVAGYTGELATKKGSQSTKVVKATLSPIAVVLCSTGPIAHTGSYRNKLRCQASGEGARFHISYRVGEGPWVSSLLWMTPGQIGEWFDLDQGEVFLEEAEQGEQVSEIRIEGKVEEGAANCTGYVDVLGLVPTRRHGVAREPLEIDVPTNLLVADSFTQAEGKATGQEAGVGGVYSAIAGSDATDFEIDATTHRLKRNAASDTGTVSVSHKGRGLTTTLEPTTVVLRHDFDLTQASTEIGSPGPSGGHMVSYVSATNMVVVGLYCDSFGKWRLSCTKNNGQQLAPISSVLFTGSRVTGTMITFVRGNRLTCYIGLGGATPVEIFTAENALIGVKGKCALYDVNTSPNVSDRYYDNLAIWEPDQPIVCASGQSLDIRAEEEERENSTGTFWSPVHYRGAHFLLDPAGDSGLVNRLAVKTRRNDIAEEPDTSLTDEQSLEVLVRERFLAPR